MKLSYFFQDLSKAYQAELEDLLSDSEGKNVWAARLREKRSQFPFLMTMIESDPEMVAVAFHGGIRFTSPHAMTLLSSTEPDEFPSWEELAQAVHFDTATQKLADTVLLERGGERFLITTVCLEYLHAKNAGFSSAAVEDDADEQDVADEHDEGEGEEHDLEEAGAEWLAEQGFDRRS
ncbi:MAG: hypothetical protein V4632_17180 [Pseudomonadota bacterium]